MWLMFRRCLMMGQNRVEKWNFRWLGRAPCRRSQAEESRRMILWGRSKELQEQRTGMQIERWALA